jgi:hypothetical protein
MEWPVFRIRVWDAVNLLPIFSRQRQLGEERPIAVPHPSKPDVTSVRRKTFDGAHFTKSRYMPRKLGDELGKRNLGSPREGHSFAGLLGHHVEPTRKVFSESICQRLASIEGYPHASSRTPDHMTTPFQWDTGNG